MIKYFYRLEYYKNNDEDTFNLGVFSCVKNARKKQKQAETQPGFRDNPNNFRLIKFGVKFDDNAVVKKSETVLYCISLEYEQTVADEIYDYYYDFGYYATEREAQKIVEYKKNHSRVGKKYPNNFVIDRVQVDTYNDWSKGFVPWDE